MRGLGIAAPFAATLFVSAFLCFIAEPMFGKMMLPPLGGAPAVWNTCVIFFQAALLAGYAYSHVLTTRFGLRGQTAIHGALLVVAIANLPLAVPAGWVPPVDRNPVPWLLLVLLTSIGTPFFFVSSAAPLLQRWFSMTTHQAAADPYFLYAVSNAGSLLALLSYPLVIEPRWSLADQRGAWSGGFIALGVLMSICAIVTSRTRAHPSSSPGAGVRSAPIAWRRKFAWAARAAVPSSLMLAVTTYASTDIAAVPLLWVLPLAIYLISFVLVFGTHGSKAALLADRLMPWSMLALTFVLIIRLQEPVWLLLPLHLFVFSVCATALHGRLAADRPSVNHLTSFFLWIGVGGLIGGVANTLVAPAVLTGVTEYAVALVLAAMLRSRATAWSRRPDAADLAMPVGLGLAALAVLATQSAGVLPVPAAGGLIAAILVFAHMASVRPVRFAATIGVLLLTAELAIAADREVVFSQRTFFGVYRIGEGDGVRTLVHGTTVHGRQRMTVEGLPEPLTYFHRAGPIGQVLTALSGDLDRASMAVIGLGTGSLAAYAREGQRWTFFEIDPAVERIARNPRWFSFLTTCGARCTVVLGDARLSLRQFDGVYNLMMFDAFSSDAIPIHLLTREALDLYLSRITEHGILAFHISNRHLDLAPVLTALAQERSLVTRVQRYVPSVSESKSGAVSSEWLLMARSESAMGVLADDQRWQLPSVDERARPWTDDFSQLVGIVKFR